MADHSLLGPLVNAVRRHGDPVTWTFPGVNLGNFLYLWQHAATARRAGVRESVLLQDSVEPWLEVFPALRELSRRRAQVRPWDRRVLEHDHSELGVDFTLADLDAFVHERLLSAPGFADAVERATDPGELVVNVRRGDYYSVPAFRALYGFDQDGYLRAAVAGSVAADGPPRRVRVVSDGLDWCREHLGWLEDVAPTRFGSIDEGPLGDLAQVCAATRLVITNSSFSYWGAYVSGVRSGRPASVWAPRLHRRDINGGRAWQLHPAWQVVDELPGGWDERP
ncbi:hypothetical protein GCM10011519_27300 [Marmoricola endophyticus]|uniref:Alpha-1,2-fucosyltransferase n=1 Tax=Marmoricola endophyticus TaxID=2040280 RepID=A0A917BRJ5_9ACTN|nr:alpha-1,2-fucosyltransferase [Marmoricola endophyticus]GGF51813.1 hypothetical protein GCM10011519_27300 [Marmoricola endophyticus]